MKNQTAYSVLAREYYDPFHKTCRNFDEATRSALRNHPPAVPKEGSILEVGCGRGRCTEFLGINGDRIVQLDSCPEMLALTDRERSYLRVNADAASVPLFDAQFSGIVGFLVDPFIGLSFFSEASRLLVPGGVLIATTPAAEWGYALRGDHEPDASYARFVTKRKDTVLVPSTLIPQKRLAEMLAHSGFTSISIAAEPLPPGVSPISPDIESAAEKLSVKVHELPLLYLIQGTKPMQV